MHLSAKTLLLYFFLFVGFSFSSSPSFASVASDMRVIVVSPFPYSEDGVPQNVKDEMAINVDLPRAIAKYFTEANAFKSVTLVKSDKAPEQEADLFVHGEILYVSGGNGAARYFPTTGGNDGRASILVGIKVFDAQHELLHEVRVEQAGTRGVTIVSAWSNKENITSAMRALPQKIFPIVIGGDLETPEGVIRALKSGNAIAMRTAAISSHTHGLFRNQSVTDAMETIVLKAIESGNKDRDFIDSIAWCLTNIGESGNKKYTTSLIKVIESDARSKIKKYAKKALKNIKKVN